MANRYVKDDAVELFEVLLEEAGWYVPDVRPVTVKDLSSGEVLSYFSWLWSQVTRLPDFFWKESGKRFRDDRVLVIRQKRVARNRNLRVSINLAALCRKAGGHIREGGNPRTGFAFIR